MTMGIHSHNGGKVYNFELPNRLRRTELLQEIDIWHALNALGQDLCRPTDCVQIHTAIFAASGQRSLPHAAFANDSAQAEITHNLPLVRFFTDGRSWPGGDAFPISLFVLYHDRPAMIEDAAAQTDAGRQSAPFM